MLPYAPMAGTTPHFLRAVAVLLGEEFYRPSEILIQQMDISFQLLFLVKGEVGETSSPTPTLQPA